MLEINRIFNTLTRSLFFVILILSLHACASNPESKHPVVKVETTHGDIFIEVYDAAAPITAKHFLNEVDKGTYVNTKFYRVLQSDPGGTYNTGILQGGVYGSTLVVDKIQHEATNTSKLTHTNGTVSMARLEPGTASSEFFICIGDQSSLDYGRRGTEDSLGMAAFGKVIEGMDVVKSIHSEAANGDKLVKPVIIKRMVKL